MLQNRELKLSCFYGVMAFCLLLAVGCKAPQPPVEILPPPITEHPNLPGIDNSEYELVNKQIVVHGMGDSQKQQIARDKSRQAALDTVVLILQDAVKHIAESRGFNAPAIDKLTIRNTKAVEEKTTAYNNDEGVRIYRSRQTLSIDAEPLLKEVYDKLELQYGWYAFLRDIDQQLNKRNTTKK